MEKFQTSDIPKSPRIQKLVDALYEHMPVIESARAKLITESYKETEGDPIITRRAKAFAHILHKLFFPLVFSESAFFPVVSLPDFLFSFYFLFCAPKNYFLTYH